MRRDLGNLPIHSKISFLRLFVGGEVSHFSASRAVATSQSYELSFLQESKVKPLKAICVYPKSNFTCHPS